MVKNLSASAGNTGNMGLIPGLGRSSEEEMATHFISPGKSHGQSSLVGYGLWSCKDLDMI